MAALATARCLFRSFSRTKNAPKQNHILIKCGVRGLCSVAPHKGDSKPTFTDPKVQDILTRITGLDLEKVFHPKKEELKPPSYKLMTDKQLEQAVKSAKEEARTLLQMPPVLPERQPVDNILSHDEILDGMDTAKYVFTDITYDVPHRERFIVVRETNGILRKAFWEERDRLIQVYFPKEGRKITVPLIFTEENLKIVFSDNRHKDVLDLCLVQFEPDSSDFIRIHTATYEALEKQGTYNLLRSSRHFGGMTWYLVNARRVDGLITDMLKRYLLDDAISLVSLFNMVHPRSESAREAARLEASGTELLKIYGQKESQMASFIELVLQAYEQSEDEQSAA